MKKGKVLILIPAFNEAKVIGQVLDNLPRKFKNLNLVDFVVIDDGSTDETASIAVKKGYTVIRHVLNSGLGTALGTGFEYAKQINADYVVTFDADGQHEANDISKLLQPLTNNLADVVIGSRLLKSKNVPLIRKLIIFISNIFTFLLYNIWTTDSQSGLRAFNRKAFHRIKIRTLGMEVSSEIFKEVQRLHLKFTEVPINTLYTDYSVKKGQKISNAPNVAWKLIIQQFN